MLAILTDMEETPIEQAWRRKHEELRTALDLIAHGAAVIEVRWCGLCEDHVGHTYSAAFDPNTSLWERVEGTQYCCLGGKDGRKVKR